MNEHSILSTEVIAQKIVKVPLMLEIREFKALRYPGRRPCLNTLRKWVRTGILQGEIKDGMYFVDLSIELASSGDKLLDKILDL